MLETAEAASVDQLLGPRVTLEEWVALAEDVPGECVDGRLVEEEVPDDLHEVLVAWLARVLGDWAEHVGAIVGASDAEPLSTRAARMRIYNALVRELDSDGSNYSKDLSEVDLSDPEDVKVTVASTLIFYANPTTCTYQFAVVKREGIKTVGGKAVVKPAEPAKEVPEEVRALEGTYTGAWTMYGINDKGEVVKKMSWTDTVKATGAEVMQEPTDQPWGARDCAFRDPAGNTVRIQELR